MGSSPSLTYLDTGQCNGVLRKWDRGEALHAAFIYSQLIMRLVLRKTPFICNCGFWDFVQNDTVLLPIAVRDHTSHVVGNRMVVLLGYAPDTNDITLNFVQEYDFG